MFNKLFRELFFDTNKETKQGNFELESIQETAKKQFIWLHKKGMKFPIVSS